MSENTSLKSLMTSLDKEFGKGHVRLLSDDSFENLDRESSGSIKLDLKTGGGFVYGKITYLKGWEGAGKTTLMIHSLAKASWKHPVAYIDCEHALNMDYLVSLGMNRENCLFSQPDSLEDSIRITNSIANSGIVRMIGYDSVASTVPEKELTGELSDHNIGLKAKLMSRFMRMLVPMLNKNNVAAIFLNQLRENPGAVFTSPEVEPAGNAMKFASFLTLNLKRGKAITNKEGENIGHILKIKGEKNKGGLPFKSLEIPLIYGVGIDTYQEIVDLGVEHGIINKSGAWYSYQDAKVGQGMENTKQFLLDNPELYDTIYEQIKSNLTNK